MHAYFSRFSCFSRIHIVAGYRYATFIILVVCISLCRRSGLARARGHIEKLFIGLYLPTPRAFNALINVYLVVIISLHNTYIIIIYLSLSVFFLSSSASRFIIYYYYARTAWESKQWESVHGCHGLGLPSPQAARAQQGSLRKCIAAV